MENFLNSIVGKARLPSKETLEGLMVLRSAWDVVDIGQLNLFAYKYFSKFVYLFILLSGIFTVGLTIFADYVDSTMTAFDSSMSPTGSLIFYLSVASTFVTALNAYINPSGRWRQIRSTTCNLESAIWQYRTRTGQFKMQLLEADKSTTYLKPIISSAVESPTSSTDIGQSTSWSKKYSKSVFKHGQYSLGGSGKPSAAFD